MTKFLATSEGELRLHLGEDCQLTFYRLAVTQDQIAEFDLPTKPRKVGDKRSAHVRETVEAAAMPAAVLRAMLRHEIESFLPPRALEIARIAEQEERAQLHRWAQMIST